MGIFWAPINMEKHGNIGGWLTTLGLPTTLLKLMIRPGRLRPLYNRKAFPWTPQQATPKAPQKAGIWSALEPLRYGLVKIGCSCKIGGLKTRTNSMSNFFWDSLKLYDFDTKFWKSTIVRVLWYPHQRTSDGETSPKRWELQEAPCGSCSCRLEDGLWGDSTIFHSSSAGQTYISG